VLKNSCPNNLKGHSATLTSEWTLEVVNSKGTSTVWDDLFPSDETANQEFLRTLDEEGMAAFLDSAKVVPFRR